MPPVAGRRWGCSPSPSRWGTGGSGCRGPPSGGRAKFSRLLNTGDAALAVAVGFLWFQTERWPGHEQDGVRVAEAAGLALVAFAYGVATRYRALGVFGQVFLVASVVFLFDLARPSGDASSCAKPSSR